jgi:hypothetical protein
LLKKRERLVKAGKCTEAEAVALELNQLNKDSYYESYQSALHQRQKAYSKERSRLRSKRARLVKAGKCTKAINQELKQLEQKMDPPATPDEAPLSPVMSLPPPYNAYIPPSVAAASPNVMLDFMDGLTMTALAHGSNNTALAIRAMAASRSARAPHFSHEWTQTCTVALPLPLFRFCHPLLCKLLPVGTTSPLLRKILPVGMRRPIQGCLPICLVTCLSQEDGHGHLGFPVIRFVVLFPDIN